MALYKSCIIIIIIIYPFIESTSQVISSRCITASLIYLLTSASAVSLSITQVMSRLSTVHGRGRQTYRQTELA